MTTRAYKFLAEGSVGPFTGWAWNENVGKWVSSVVDLDRGTGVHACRARDLAYWLDAELWRIELDGDQHELPTQIVASRAKLVEPITEWPKRARDFCEFCVDRVRGMMTGRNDSLLAGYAIDTEQFALLKMPGTVAYVAATAATAAGLSFEGERLAQSQFLSRALGL